MKIIIKVESDANHERVKFFVNETLLPMINDWIKDNFQNYKNAEVIVEDG